MVGKANFVKLLVLLTVILLQPNLFAEDFLIPVTGRKDLILDHTRNLVYITANETLYRFDIASREMLTPFNASGVYLHGADITQDGQYLYSATRSNNIAKIDLDSGATEILTFVAGRGESGTWDLKITGNNKAFFSTIYAGSGWLPLGIIDLADDTITRYNRYTEPIRFARSFDRNILFIPTPNNSGGPIYLYDARVDAITFNNRLLTSLSNSQSSVNRDGSMIAMEFGGRIDFLDSSLNKFDSIACYVGGVEFHPSTNVLYYTDVTNDDLVAIETESFTEVFHTHINEDLLHSDRCGFGHGEMVIDPSSSLLFLSTTMGVRVIDIPEVANTAPVADAGQDQVAWAWIDGLAEVKLDGTGSYDDDGDPLGFNWYNDANDLIATEPDPNLLFGVGEYEVTLIVNDGIENSEPNTCKVTVLPSIETQMSARPSVVSMQKLPLTMMVKMKLPAGTEQFDIDSSMTLEPWGIEAVDQSMVTRGKNNLVFAYFEIDSTLEFAPDSMEIIAVGKLLSGEYVYASDSIKLH